MFDVSKCRYEESVSYADEHVHYFKYPKDMSLALFAPEEHYGNVTSMTVALAENGVDFGLAVSPTVSDGDMESDVDWQPLSFGDQSDAEIMSELLKKVRLA